MAQRTIVRPTPEYSFNKSGMEAVASTFSRQSTTISGTTVLTFGVIANPNIRGAITTENAFIPTLTRRFAPNFAQTFFAVRIALIQHIDFDGKSLQLAKAVPVNVTYQDDEYFCRNEELGIITMSTTLDECIKDFKEEILFVWNEYGKASDDILTDGAKELKRRIQQYVAK